MPMHFKQLIEAALFVSTDPVSIEELYRITGISSREEIEEAIDSLIEEYNEKNSALEIRRIGGDSYIMQARDAFSGPLLALVKPVVSDEVLKTLSIIALKQPITQAEVVKARGYRTYAHVKELLSKEFIAAEPHGRTKLLTTTQKFADYFSLPGEPLQLKKELARQLNIEE
jgi:segregation and condensation protein B